MDAVISQVIGDLAVMALLAVWAKRQTAWYVAAVVGRRGRWFWRHRVQRWYFRRMRERALNRLSAAIYQLELAIIKKEREDRDGRVRPDRKK